MNEEDPKKLRVGWVIKETVGIAVINDYGISRVEITDRYSNAVDEDVPNPAFDEELRNV